MKRLCLTVVVALMLGGTANAEHHHKAWNKFFAGSWELQLQELGGQMDLKLVGDGVAVIGTGKSDSGEVGAWIMGWDPAEKLIVHQWFGTDHGRVLYKSVDDKTLRGPGEIHGSDKVTKGTVTITKKNEDSYTVHWTDVTVDGQKADDIRLTVRRK
jgi:hypothetical protein